MTAWVKAASSFTLFFPDLLSRKDAPAEGVPQAPGGVGGRGKGHLGAGDLL